MQIDDTEIADVKIITPRRYGDARGWFAETWNSCLMNRAGLRFDWVQDNQSYSAGRWTVRGLHYQAPPSAQAKLVRVTRGSVIDVAVDVRRGSPTYLRSVSVTLSAEDGAQLLIPRGFLHGFATLEADTEVLYKVDAPYDAAADGAVRYDDPRIGIDWSLIEGEPILSDKDAAAPLLEDWESPFVYGET